MDFKFGRETERAVEKAGKKHKDPDKYKDRDKMENNSSRNKDFKNAARNQDLSESEERKFSKFVHEHKGNLSYKELEELAKQAKGK